MLFKLNILGENDAIVKTYTTSKIKMGLMEDLITLQDTIKGKSVAEQFKAIKPLLLKMFTGLTEEEIENVEFTEILKTITQLMEVAREGFGVNEKN